MCPLEILFHVPTGDFITFDTSETLCDAHTNDLLIAYGSKFSISVTYRERERERERERKETQLTNN